MEDMQELERSLSKLTIENWLHNDLFTWRWWLLVGLTALSLVIWWRILDKTRRMEIVLYGLFISLNATFLDVLGWNLNLWTYPHKFLPLCTPLFPVDFVLIPVFYMLIFQRFHSWRSFFWVNAALAAFMAFILEPLNVWLEFYKPLAWKHIYSYPIYITIALIGKQLISKLKDPGV